MTAATGSAYPRSVDELIPHARDLADKLGETPSRNLLKKTFRIGPDKAKALLAVIAPAPAAPVPADDPEPVEAPPVEPVEPVEVPDPERPAVSSVGIFESPEEAARWRNQLTPPLATPPALRVAEPVDDSTPKRRRLVVWPVLILCLPAFVAIWGGWVEMGRLTGFGMVTLLPGVSDFQINTSVTLPIGVETYAAYALYVWLSGLVTGTALRFAKWSAIASLVVGGLGQIAYHLMSAAGWESAPWPITAAVACIPVAVLGMGAGLAHLMHRSH